MFAAAPDAAPALKTRTSTSETVGIAALAGGAGWDERGHPPRVGSVPLSVWSRRDSCAPGVERHFPVGPCPTPDKARCREDDRETGRAGPRTAE